MSNQANLSLSNTYWRSIGFFNLYRIIISTVFVFSYWAFANQGLWENYNSSLYLKLSISYFIFSLFAAASTWARWPSFDRQVLQQTSADILFIVALMFAAGGIKSGIGLLLIIAIIAASLISEGRLALFYAALASISLLLEQSYQLVSWEEHYDEYSHAVMLCISCFATAWLAHSFAKRTLKSEALATQREVDLENLAQINTLITQEMQDGVIVVDRNYKVRHHNQQAEGLLSLDSQAWYAKSLEECAPELANLMHKWVTHSLEGASNTIKFHWFDRELRLRFMPVADNRNQGAVIFIEDWSQMQAQAQQLKLAALGRLTANIAHEIRNPLSAISHANQLLQEDASNDVTSQRMLQIIADNVERMDQMVKDVLELNRRDRTKQELINLGHFIEDFHHHFCQVEKVPESVLKIESSSSPIFIEFDKRHLHQILWNLCRNGWRHCKQRDGSLRITIIPHQQSKNIQVHVSDDGPGVEDINTTHLFEPFFTTESTGTGLGLYIARELSEANGASLKYAGSDQGGLFIIQLKKPSVK